MSRRTLRQTHPQFKTTVLKKKKNVLLNETLTRKKHDINTVQYTVQINLQVWCVFVLSQLAGVQDCSTGHTQPASVCLEVWGGAITDTLPFKRTGNNRCISTHQWNPLYLDISVCCCCDTESSDDQTMAGSSLSDCSDALLCQRCAKFMRFAPSAL